MKRPEIEITDREELVSYIAYQDKILNGVSNLKKQILLLADAIAKELESINEGKDDPLKILKGDEKLFERISLLVKNKADWMSLTITEETETTTVKKVKSNIQDFVVKPK